VNLYKPRFDMQQDNDMK